ncbi:hypothetical protein SARC_02837, partial [Sphaeroforma arctica JP610]
RVQQACKLVIFTTAKKTSMNTTDVSKLVSKSIRNLISAGHCHDILKKASSHLAAKYVHVLPGRIQQYIQSTVGSDMEALGILKGLDSLTPTLYINFPAGRLKLFGALAMLQNNYLVAQFNKHNVSVGDAIDSLVVYSECCWVGTAEENADEKPLPMPESIVKMLEPAAALSDENLKTQTERPLVVSDDNTDTEEPSAILISDEVSYADMDIEKGSSGDAQSDSENEIRPSGPRYVIGKKSPLKPTDEPKPQSKKSLLEGLPRTGNVVSKTKVSEKSESDSDNESGEDVDDEDEEPEYIPKPTSRGKRTLPADSESDAETEYVPRKTARTSQTKRKATNGTTNNEDTNSPPAPKQSPRKAANTKKVQASKSQSVLAKNEPNSRKMKQGTLTSMIQNSTANPKSSENAQSRTSAKKATSKRSSEFIEIDVDSDDPFSLDVKVISTQSPFKKTPFDV